MGIRRTKFAVGGELAASGENVVIRAGGCAVTLLPDLGGKISSILVGGNELLQAPLNAYATRNQTMSFAEGDAGGWDECLPSVAECTVRTAAGEARIPDHGDLWRVPWQVLDAASNSATLRANCFSLPLQLTRTLTLNETTTGWQFQFLYSLRNVGDFAVPWAWSAHPLFAVDPGDHIRLHEGVHRVKVEGSAGGTLGPRGELLPWPTVERIDGTASDLSIAQNQSSGIGDKVFAGPFEGDDSWAVLDRLRIGLRLTIRFGPQTPYLGLWLCYGGWPDGSGLKQVCIALEPTTAPGDSLAEAALWSKWLDPGETVNWPMELLIDSIVANAQAASDDIEDNR